MKLGDVISRQCSSTGMRVSLPTNASSAALMRGGTISITPSGYEYSGISSELSESNSTMRTSRVAIRLGLYPSKCHDRSATSFVFVGLMNSGDRTMGDTHVDADRPRRSRAAVGDDAMCLRCRAEGASIMAAATDLAAACGGATTGPGCVSARGTRFDNTRRSLMGPAAGNDLCVEARTTWSGFKPAIIDRRRIELGRASTDMDLQRYDSGWTIRSSSAP
mmetsp:Transcript_11589/g.29268  ORF Transcript_11589/g.29268 Transcript_11589/m.29268 type:complete len:220 (+) Transcript_11589:2507-3166(+)